MMAKEIRFSAFTSNCAVHNCPGMWSHPADRHLSHTDMEYWAELGRVLERGLFDAAFLGDGIGVHEALGGSFAEYVRHGLRVPRHDPFVTIPIMAMATRHLGFGVTGNVSFEPPYLFARRMSTLDHLTRGRVGWNVVTGHLDSGARAMGAARVKGHDARYEIAEEFMEVVYKLWEGSWDDDAMIRDRARGVFADPDKVRAISHEGEYFRVQGIHQTEPSPQRTPVIYQAGASDRGRAFAARHAEGVFVSGVAEPFIASVTADLRRRAAGFGRDPSDIKVMMMMTVIVGRTDAEAREKVADYRKYTSVEANLAMLSGVVGLDLSQFPLDDPFPVARKDTAVHSAVDSYTSAATRPWTIREVIEQNAIGGRGAMLVGSAETVATGLQHWMEATDIDGFNLSYALMPGDYAAVADLLVPVLQERGLYKTGYRQGTLREEIFGPGRARLPASHPAAAHRFRAADAARPQAVPAV